MAPPDHYATLKVHANATQTEIKQAYRRLAKQWHPDSQQANASHERITQLNAAYEVLGDPDRRRSYDQARLLSTVGLTPEGMRDRVARTTSAQAHYRQQRRSAPVSDDDLQFWLNRVYTPVNRAIDQIIKPLKRQLNDLAADPFDDDLMEDFQAYLEASYTLLNRAEKTFKSLPNPPNAAGAAAHLYYCLNQLSDGLEQLEFFTLNYDDSYLHTGQELFRIAAGLKREAQAAVKAVK